MALSRTQLPSGSLVWSVTDCALARKVLNDPRFSKQRAAESVGTHFIYRHMLTLDPPEHTRLRGFVAGHFLPGRIQLLRARIAEDADELIARMRESERVELVSQFARPLALRAICTLTGVPRQDAPSIESWAERLV